MTQTPSQTLSIVRRTRKTGIRNVVGAGTADNLFLISRDILRWAFAAALLALLVAGLTMSWHALRAARAEPARSLRYE